MRLEFFDMIDGIKTLDRKEQTILTESAVPVSSPIFEGHFPNYPRVPGVLLTEVMAQASGYLILCLNGCATMPFLAGIDKARFHAFVEPDCTLWTQACCLHEGSGYYVTQASIYRGTALQDPVVKLGPLLCRSELRFSMQPFPPSLRTCLYERMIRLGLMDSLPTEV